MQAIQNLFNGNTESCIYQGRTEAREENVDKAAKNGLAGCRQTTRSGPSKPPDIDMTDIALRMTGVEQSVALSWVEGPPLARVLIMGFLSVLFVGKATAPAVEQNVPYRWAGRKTGNDTYESRDSHESSPGLVCKKVKLVISHEMLDEYSGIAQRLENKYPEVKGVEKIKAIAAQSEITLSLALPEQMCEDRDDDMFLSAAPASKSKIIVSGDKHLKDISGWRGISVLSPSAFAALIMEPQPPRR